MHRLLIATGMLFLFVGISIPDVGENQDKVYALEQSSKKKAKTESSVEKEKPRKPTESKSKKKKTWKDNPKKCNLEKQYISAEAPFKCINKPSMTVSEAPQQSQPAPARSSGGNIETMIRRAARKHGVDENWLVRVASCESGFNPSAVNTGYYAGGGNPTGLFQYLPETWSRIGGRSPYGVGNIWSAQDQANVTAWAFANGYSGEWECK